MSPKIHTRESFLEARYTIKRKITRKTQRRRNKMFQTVFANTDVQTDLHSNYRQAQSMYLLFPQQW